MSESADIKNPAGTPVVDPVCGKPVDPLRARAVGIYGGVTQYFCSPECKARYADPRRAESAPPTGVERRWKDEPREASGAWFEKGQTEVNTPVRVERFSDLDEAAPLVKMAPTPSLLIQIEATKKRRWPWLVLVLALGGMALWLLGHRA